MQYKETYYMMHVLLDSPGAFSKNISTNKKKLLVLQPNKDKQYRATCSVPQINKSTYQLRTLLSN